MIQYPAKKHFLIAMGLGFLLIVIAYLVTPTPKHPEFYHNIPGFWGVFGFVSCSLIIIVSKALGKFLQVEENWYDLSKNESRNEAGNKK